MRCDNVVSVVPCDGIDTNPSTPCGPATCACAAAAIVVLALDVHMLQPHVHVSPCVEVLDGMILAKPRRQGSDRYKLPLLASLDLSKSHVKVDTSKLN